MTNVRWPTLIPALSLVIVGCKSNTLDKERADTPSEGTSSASSPTGAATRDRASSAPTGSFTFAWKLPCRVPVDETSDKGGHKARIRFFAAARELANDEVEVRWDDMQFIEFDGQPVTGALRKELGPLLAFASAIPSLIVTKDGTYVGARGIDETIERVLAFPEIGTKEGSDRIAAVMRSPQTKAAISSAVGDYWKTWVGSWVGWSVAPGGKAEGATTVPLGAETLPARAMLEHLGDAGAGFAHLASTTTIDDPAVLRSVLGLVRGLSGGADPGTSVTDFRVVTRVEVETDPKTLRPRWTKYDKTMMVASGAEKKTEHEVREDRFDWAHAEGCR